MKNQAHFSGFTLVEMAVVLVIAGLLLGGLLVPLSAQRDLKDYGEVRINLEQIKEALYGYALSNIATDGKPHFPCPDTDGDGAENRTGSACTAPEGDLPTRDLGLPNTDSWNNRYDYRVTLAFADNAVGFTLATAGDITVRDASGGIPIVLNVPALVLSRGKNGANAAVSADEVENTNSNNTFVSRDFSPTFDDVVVWISPNILFNRMVAAGKLP
jgi:prepilin-type N-terminal cleavage/methylation domain-containing protein